MTSEPSALKVSKCVHGCRKWSRSWRQTWPVLKLEGAGAAVIAMLLDSAPGEFGDGRRSLWLGILDEIGRDVSGLHLVELLLAAGERPFHQQVIGDVADLDLEDADGAADLRVVVRIDHLLLPGHALDRADLLQAIDLLLFQKAPVAFAGTGVIIEGLDGVGGGAFGDAQLVDVFGQADVSGPACQILAGCDVEDRHPRSAPGTCRNGGA